MSNFWMLVNIIVLLGLIVYAIGYKRSPKKHHKQNKEENRFRIYQAEEDPQIRDFRRSNFITSHPDDTDFFSELYKDNQWRFTMPHAAVDMLIECFSGDEKKAYQIKRAIELSIEHYAIEMADDAECLKIIEKRLVNTP
ncbi:hypothetical protein [Sulfuricurvum sp.]|uniref:hypothetical protein n=1 Tax=Sulfuricurvum sp. TaxID=2025608 RepID=UPI002607CF7E|nr:hypothetical protein [Sulfuricurvum sp.]MDD3594903.1 hypothetical protein [Sulfuricurvum sp.]